MLAMDETMSFIPAKGKKEGVEASTINVDTVLWGDVEAPTAALNKT